MIEHENLCRAEKEIYTCNMHFRFFSDCTYFEMNAAPGEIVKCKFYRTEYRMNIDHSKTEILHECKCPDAIIHAKLENL